MRSYLFLLALVILFMSSCEVTVKKNDGKETVKEKSNSKIKNGIVVTSNNIKVEQAFLLFEDRSLVPEDNTVSVNQTVVLRLIATGWEEKDGKVFLSASEKVETSEGDIVLNESNLFAKYTDGIDAKDARYISLNVVITAVTKLYDYYRVSFQVTDNLKPDNVITGYYKLYLK
jgi:hypothetical protein